MRTKETIHRDAAGCWFDSHRGQYIGEAVQGEALAWGWEGFDECGEVVTVESTESGSESYFWAWEEAEAFLSDLAPEGFWIGNDPDGAGFGMWPIPPEWLA